MILDQPVEEVTELVHPLIWQHGKKTSEVLHMMGIRFAVLPLEDNTVWMDKVYLACVPSLNLPGSFHQILLDTRSGDLEVLDPAEESKERYTPDNLTSWILEYEITPFAG